MAGGALESNRCVGGGLGKSVEDQRVDAEHCLATGMTRFLRCAGGVAGAGVSWSGARFGYIAEMRTVHGAGGVANRRTMLARTRFGYIAGNRLGLAMAT